MWLLITYTFYSIAILPFAASHIVLIPLWMFFFFSSRRRHTRFKCDWSSDGALPISESDSPDYEKDVRDGSFNAVKACVPESGESLSVRQRQWAIEYARGAAAEMEAALAKIELPENVRAEFAQRLRSAFSRKTGMTLTGLTEPACTHENYWKRFARAVLMPWRAGLPNAFLRRGPWPFRLAPPPHRPLFSPA